MSSPFLLTTDDVTVRAFVNLRGVNALLVSAQRVVRRSHIAALITGELGQAFLLLGGVPVQLVPLQISDVTGRKFAFVTWMIYAWTRGRTGFFLIGGRVGVNVLLFLSVD